MPLKDLDYPATSQSDSDQSAAPPERYAFVPDEVCIIVERKVALTANDALDLYQLVDPVLKALPFPVPLKRLERPEGSVAFLTKENSTAAHLYYQRDSPSNQPDTVRNREVRDLILQLNYQLRLHERPYSINNDLTITAVTPHWIGGACGGPDDDSPAAPPEPVPPAPDPRRPENWQFRFYDGTYGNADLDAIIEADRTAASASDFSNVVVAILDTSPGAAAVRSAARKYARINSLLCQVDGQIKPNRAVVVGGNFNPVSIDDPISPMATNLAHLAGIVGNWSGRLGTWLSTYNPATLAQYREDTFAMPDHGVFAAGIVKDIAPTASVHLVRMVDDAGMTDALTLADTASALLIQPWVQNKKLIVSLSVTFAVPTFEQFTQLWKSDFLDSLAPSEQEQLHAILSRNLGDTMDALVTYGALVISAVGNYDDPGQPRRPEPRYPAFFSNVLSVAAVSQERVAAAYSNCGDDAANLAHGFSHGIATLGGDVYWDGTNAPLIEGAGTTSLDAIRGVYSKKTLPHRSGTGRNGRNRTGWVYWVGTSFATPIIAGVAAALWRIHGGSGTTQMISLIQSYKDVSISRGVRPVLKCDVIYAFQEPV